MSDQVVKEENAYHFEFQPKPKAKYVRMFSYTENLTTVICKGLHVSPGQSWRVMRSSDNKIIFRKKGTL